MIIFPAIDLRKGKVVRLIQGRAEAEIIYFDDPRIPAQNWKKAGAEWIHVVDLDGAFSGEPQNWEAIEKILEAGLKVQLGGGFRAGEAIATAIRKGVSRVILGTGATGAPFRLKEFVKRFGEGIAVGIDARKGRVAVKGWVDTLEMTALELASSVAALGIRHIIYTDISRDGMLTGPNFEAQEEMLKTIPAQVIASGGVGKDEDVARFHLLASRYPNLEGVIVGRALYDGKVDLEALLKPG